MKNLYIFILLLSTSLCSLYGMEKPKNNKLDTKDKLFLVLKKMFLETDKEKVLNSLGLMKKIINEKIIDFNGKIIVSDGKKVDMDMSLLMLACSNPYVSEEIIELLINKTKNIHSTMSNGSTALHYACLSNNIPAVSLLLKKDTQKKNLNSCCEKGDTPLHFAAYQGNLDIVQYLISAGATIDAQNKVHRTPLLYACTKNKPFIVQALLQAKANPNILDKNGRGAAIRAIKCKSLEILKMLVEYGANIKFKRNGRTLLHEACLSYWNDEIVEYLLSQGLKINAKNANGAALVHLFAEFGKLKELMFLKEHGANFFLKNKEDFMPLEIAVYWGQFHVVPYLIDLDMKKVDIAVLDAGLAKAFQRGNEDIINLFLKKYEEKALLESKNKNVYIYPILLSFKEYLQPRKGNASEDLIPVYSADRLVNKYIDLYKPREEAPVSTSKKKKNKKKKKKHESKDNSIAEPQEGDTTSLAQEANEVDQKEEPVVPEAPVALIEEQPYVGMTDRVRRWEDPTWVQEQEKKAVSPQQFQQDLVCHQLPKDLVDYVIQHGKKENRENETFAPTATFNGKDTVSSLYGEIIFNNPEDNPWNPEKKRQGVLYECTEGFGELLYHANATPCNIKKKKLNRENPFERQLENPQRTLRVFLHK